MRDSTSNLVMPYILPTQAQKHVSHNEALQRLDVLVQAVVRGRGLAVPPAAPVEGESHIVAAGASELWTGQTDKIAAFYGNGWDFITPKPGWQVFVDDEDQMVVFTPSGWQAGSKRALHVAELGVGADPDGTNKLTVSSDASLFNHGGSGHQIKVNKAQITDTASLLFQSGFSGRAEMGLAGSDDFTIKVSADGTAFTQALRIGGATGQVTVGQDLLVGGAISGAAVTQGPLDSTPGRLRRTGDGGVLGAPVPAPADIGVTSNTLGQGVWYAVDQLTTPAGAPPSIQGAYQGYLFHHRRAAGGEMQLLLCESATSVADRGIWFRSRAGSGWSAWRRNYDTANAVGAVSQTGGLPTGAIVERGATANGQFVRMADGSQMCWHTLGFNALATDTTATATWTYPAPFGFAPNVSLTNLAAAPHQQFCALAAAPGPVSAQVTCRHSTGTTSSRTVQVQTVGRWF
jgi:hypothetical protein